MREFVVLDEPLNYHTGPGFYQGLFKLQRPQLRHQRLELNEMLSVVNQLFDGLVHIGQGGVFLLFFK
jgi:hypothetical protein